jgi:outer membrane receptor for ferrienterochelin and colicins
MTIVIDLIKTRLLFLHTLMFTKLIKTKPLSFFAFKVILTVAFFLFGFSSNAQIKIKLINEEDSSLLTYAPIKWTILNTGKSLHTVTNEKGEITINNAGSKVSILITYLGFEIKKDTIHQDGYYTIKLKVDLKYLPEAVVTDQYAATSPEKSINKVIVIDEKKIKSMAANNLNELLTNQLNVKLAQDNLLGSNMTLMGISGQNVKILIDGVPVIGRQNGNIDLSQINLNDIERIEIIEGPLSVAYGTNALAGAINIITKKKQLNKVTVNATTYNESAGRFNNTVNIGLRKSNGVYHISGGRNYFDGWSSKDYVRFQEWKPKEQYFGRVQYLRKIGLFDLNIKTEFFNEKLINKGTPRLPYMETAFDEYYKTRRWDNSITATSKLPHNRYLNLVAAYNVYHRTKNRYLFNRVTLDKQLVPESEEQDTSKFTAIVLRGTFTKSMMNARLNYQIGYDINSETGHGKKLNNREITISDYASFLSVEISPNIKWQIKPGIRYSYNTSYKTIPLPSLNIKWAAKKNLTIRGSYARGYRAPDLKELYLFFVDVNHNITGNQNLKPEQSHNLQASVVKKITKKSNWFQPELSLFYNTITDRIVLANIKGASYTYSNLDIFKALTTNANFGYKLKAFAGNLGASNTVISSDANGFNNPFSSFEITNNTAYTHKKSGINVSLFIKVNSQAINFVKNELGELSKSTIEGYTWADLTLSKPFFKEKWVLGIGAKNILNVTSVTSNGNTGGTHSGNGNALQLGMGRIYFLKLDYNFVKK